MENQTRYNSFHILAFSTDAANQLLICIVFFFIYVIGILGNLVMITVVCMDSHLHIPMYIFLCNLSIVDICFTTVTLPKLMDILLTGNTSISFIQCFTQMFFCTFLAGTEIILLSSMAYDRYVAICHPLHYHNIMNKEICVLLLGGTWLSGCLNAIFYTCVSSNVYFCHSNKIHHFFCDIKALAKLSCVDMTFQVIFFIESFLFGLLPFLFSLISYIKIISTIIGIRSTDSRKKAFSTCTSHLTVLTIFYGTILCIYLRPPLQQPGDLDQVFSVLYAALTPMLNPLIYSLRNREVKCALTRILSIPIK